MHTPGSKLSRQIWVGKEYTEHKVVGMHTMTDNQPRPRKYICSYMAYCIVSSIAQ